MSDSDILSQTEIDNLLNSLIGSDGEEDSSVPSTEENNTEQANNIVATQSAQPAPVSFKEEAVESLKKGYKLYNFRRPDKFSKDHLRALQDIHREFSRNLALVLSAYLRMPFDIDVVSVDQLTYEEFTRSMSSPITIGILELNPLPGQVLLVLSYEISSSIVDRMLGGLGMSETRPRELTDVEEALVKRIFEKVVKSIEEAWQNIFPVKGSIVDIENSYSFIQIVSPGEIVALITFEVQIADINLGLMSLCFPYPVLEMVISQLTTQHIFQSKGYMASTEDQQKILSKLALSKAQLSVILGEAEITMRELLDLRVGDVLKLDTFVNDSLKVKVNEEDKFLGRVGTMKNKLAISVTDELSQDKAMEE